MPDFRQRLILFKPMRPGVSGYARLQSERGALLAQLNARGLEAESVQAYWYGAGGEARLWGATRVNAHGEASLTAELPLETRSRRSACRPCCCSAVVRSPCR